jgi:hypothetical protein
MMSNCSDCVDMLAELDGMGRVAQHLDGQDHLEREYFVGAQLDN